MINYSNTAPPESVDIGGAVFSINTDYRIWIDISQKLLEFDSSDNSQEVNDYNIQLMIDIFITAFGEIPNCPYQDTLQAIINFLHGYPQIKGSSNQTTTQDGTKLYSFKHDLNYILIAIRNQSGLDLSYRCKHFHWWLFMLEFQTLEDRHFVCQLMKRRAYNGKDPELIKLRESVALPKDLTRSEQRLSEEIDALFYNT